MNTNNLVDDLFNETKIMSAPDDIGTPEEDALFSPGPQERADSCAIKVQQHVLSMFGINKTETDLVSDAMSHGEYGTPDHTGTCFDDVGNLLERNGLEVNRYEGATMAHLISELGQGHKIIVGVDAYEIIADTPEEQFIEIQRDLVNETPNHAILVTNVDPHTLDVDIVDPLDGQTHTISAAQFSDAWKDSNFFMVSTVQSPREYLSDWATQQPQSEEAIENLESGGERTMFENDSMNYIDTTGDGIADIIESDLNQDGLVENLAVDLNGDSIPDVTIQSNPGLQRMEPSLGGLGHASGYNVAEAEPSLGGLGHASGYNVEETEPSLGGLGHASGYNAVEVEPSLGGLGHASGYDDLRDVDAAAYDMDSNGINDTVAMDLDQDGHMDLFGVDLDSDGIMDAVAMDTNADGIPDIVGIDLNGDGTVDAFGIDVNGDGVADTAMSADDFNSTFFDE